MISRTPTRPVVVVDDEPDILLAVYATLLAAGFDNVVTVPDSRDALGVLRNQNPSLVLLDLGMPFVSGEEVLDSVTRELPAIPVVVITATDTVDTAVRCMRCGAADYLVKPVDAERLLATVRGVLEVDQLRSENASLRATILADRLAHPEAFEAIVTRSPLMQSQLRYADAVACTGHPVLVMGETGTGKELVARAVHLASGRTGQFVPVHAAGLDDSVFSDTLFGHVRGAFPGADRPRLGLLEQAAHGTLFLDEIGDLSLASQGKLLRVLQEREFFPLGSDLPRRSTARIVVSTHLDLEEACAASRFRKDLYHRLAAHTVRLPPLRNRKEDVVLLAEHFAAEAAEKPGETHLGGATSRNRGRQSVRLDPPTGPGLATRAPAIGIPSGRRRFQPAALDMLSRFSWPGNVRQLRLVVFDVLAASRQHGVTSSEVRLRLATATMDAPPPAEGDAGRTEGILFPRMLPTLKQCAGLLIQEALRRTSGNQTLASRLLGVTQPALSKRLKRQASDTDSPVPDDEDPVAC